MKISRVFHSTPFLMLFKYSLVNSYSYKYKYDVENFEPVQYIDFNLLSGDQVDVSRNKYQVMNANQESQLPLLSRGEREIDEDDDEWEDSVRVPSCSELKKMWKIARRIHAHAIKTNEIPQKLHPFSHFESDRWRTKQRFKNKAKSKTFKTRSKPGSQGSKEVTEANYGIIRYAPSETVKRPGSGEKVYDVLRKLNPDVDYKPNKDAGEWATGILEFEPETIKVRPFDTLRNKLRAEKKLPPMPEKSVSQRKDIWGKIITHYKNKGAVKNNLDTVREQLLSDSRRPSRLNYRDENSGAIRSSYSRGGETSFGQHWNSRSSKKHRKQRNRMKAIQRDLASRLRFQISQEAKKRKKGGKKKFRSSKNHHLQNFFMKGQL